MSHYLATLPLACPANLAVRSDADLALAALSLHAWKVDLLARERQRMSESAGHEVLPFSSDEVAWATCMKLSRAYAGVGHGPVMMPFVDLVNHGFGRSSTCVERGSWVDEASGAWQASLVARRDLAAGEELTYEYHQTPSRARMLSSFGFATDNMPSASLAANGLPERDPQWLALHGCVPPLRTDLFLQAADADELERMGRTRLSPNALRESVRCIRLSLYSPDEAVWALHTGHLDDAPWGGRADVSGWSAEEVALLRGVLMADHRVVLNTATLCAAAVPDEQRAAAQQRLAAASDDLAAAIGEEMTALSRCAEGFGVAEQAIAQRGAELFGWGED